MDCASLPALLLAVVAFLCGGFYLLLWAGRGRGAMDLSFALTCLAVGFYDIFAAGLYQSAAPVDGVRWQRLQLIALALANAAFLRFVADYLALRRRRLVHVLALLSLVYAAVATVERGGLCWTDRPLVKQVLLPFGLETTYYEMAPGPLTILQGLLGILVFAVVMILAVRAYRAGRRREMRPLIAALLVFFAGVFNDTAVSSGLYRAVYLIEYAYVALVLLMGFTLARELVEAARVRAELQVSEAALREREATLRSVFRAAPIGIGLVDGQRVLGWSNAALQRMTGYAGEELRGRPARLLYETDEEHARVGRVKHAQVREAGLGAVETRWRRKDGVVLDILLSSAAIDPGTMDAGLVFTAMDITERQRARGAEQALIGELEEKNAELERFAYTVSHDLRSPLITIRAFAQLLDKDSAAGDAERVRADIARIVTATEKMEMLLHDLLELSRIGRLANPEEEIDLGELAREAAAAVEGRYRQAGIALDIASDLPRVVGDRVRLLEVLQNLLDNAAKFMGGQAAPRVEVGSRTEGGETVVTVRDNGVGIAPENADRIFGLFAKLDTGGEGTGIGLAIVKRIVEHHRGRIWVESAGVGRGACFCFTLPRGVPIPSGSGREEPAG
ncbi:MAG: PAS domain S-box protein [Candidatus Krumholzibacteriota bacterium]|nr:PAS domain S-box protein [Candidatus Krumholzibacteriota bacterium]